MHTRSWEEAAEGITGLSHEATAQSTDLEGNPIEVSGCSLQEFEPRISSKTTTGLADSPSGLDFTLHQPQNQGQEQQACGPRPAAEALQPRKVVMGLFLPVNPPETQRLIQRFGIGYRGLGGILLGNPQPNPKYIILFGMQFRD